MRTVVNTRCEEFRFRARFPEQFERELDEVEWFAQLGEPSPWDGDCQRIFGWDQWPGPENAQGEAFDGALQEMHDLTFAHSPVPEAELWLVFDRTLMKVKALARAALGVEGEGDSWDPPTACIWSAGYTAALIMCVLASGWSVPDDLVEIWNWYAAGHWPSSFAGYPGDEGIRSGEKLVFPRQLLVC